MNRLLAVFLVMSLLPISCSKNKENANIQAKEEILQTEKDFAALAAEQGVQNAFLTFAADRAILNRGGRIIQGKNEMKQFFESQALDSVQLKWSPDFVDVSASCDLGYTYGKYTYSAVDSAGQKIEAAGIFHTVWKKQNNGRWRFVYD